MCDYGVTAYLNVPENGVFRHGGTYLELHIYLAPQLHVHTYNEVIGLICRDHDEI